MSAADDHIYVLLLSIRFGYYSDSMKLQRVTCNNLLYKLKANDMLDEIKEVAALMKTASVEPNETTKKILQVISF